MSARGPVRAVIVGAGLMGRWHADALTRAGAVVAAVVDPDRRKACELAARYAGAAVLAQLGDIGRVPPVDVAHICTPTLTHAALATEALCAGLHVLAEKPLTETADLTADLVDLAQARGLVLCPVHQLLYQPGVLQAQQALDAHGPALHVEMTICSAGADGRTDGERDSLVADILPHPLSLLARMFPKQLPAIEWCVAHPIGGEVRLVGTVGRATVSILVSTRGRPTVNMVRLVGARGTVWVDLFHGFHVLEHGAVSRTRKLLRPFHFSASTLQAAATNLVGRASRAEFAYPGLRPFVRRFYQSVRGEASPPLDTREILDVATVRDAIIQRMLM